MKLVTFVLIILQPLMIVYLFISGLSILEKWVLFSLIDLDIFFDCICLSLYSSQKSLSFVVFLSDPISCACNPLTQCFTVFNSQFGNASGYNLSDRASFNFFMPNNLFRSLSQLTWVCVFGINSSSQKTQRYKETN